MFSTEVTTDLKCYHCAQPCDEIHWLLDKPFCCGGCKTVFEILNENDLCDYYAFDERPGVSLRNINETSFSYLDEPTIRKKVLSFDSPSFASVQFSVPSVHCVSCIWLLENLQKIREGVLRSEVNFARRTVKVDFNPALVTPGKLAGQLAALGYVPKINLAGLEQPVNNSDGQMIIKLVVAGFAFGNIMLLSFPEYLGMDNSDGLLQALFPMLNILLTIPVILYSARDYFTNAFKSYSQRQINIDVPIAAGLFALFARSLYDIVSQTGPGYLDSLTGLVFFLLIGRWFQSKTYERLAFDRDYKSYFPLAVSRWLDGQWIPAMIQDLQVGDRIKIRNLEVVPADCVLQSEKAYIDYGFVTGESKPTKVLSGEALYAGGRLVGQSIELLVTKRTSQSHLTSLWNNPTFERPVETGFRKTIDKAARTFTWMVMFLAVATAVVWYFYDPSRMWLVLTSVLMVACPCALALAAPFTYGTLLRVFGKNHLYLKNADVIERMAAVNTVVFDKTGTITFSNESDVRFEGELSGREIRWIRTLTGFSTHPLSDLIYRSMPFEPKSEVEGFQEIPGQGIQGESEGHIIKLGSASFTGFRQTLKTNSAVVFVSVDDEVRGYFLISIAIRNNLKEMIGRLGDKCFALLSGDNASDRSQMRTLFGPSVRLEFGKSPIEKLQFIAGLQSNQRRVMMLGDGLNDAGALRQSDVGIAVTDDTSLFNPACDGILKGEKVESLDRLLSLAKSGQTILMAGFGISFAYNVMSLSFAITGHLTPLVAAVLMPMSSITVVVFSSLAVQLAARLKLKKSVLI